MCVCCVARAQGAGRVVSRSQSPLQHRHRRVHRGSRPDLHQRQHAHQDLRRRLGNKPNRTEPN